MKPKLLSGLFALILAASLIPSTRAQTYGAAYMTAITYQNVSESTASITFSFYSEGGSNPINANYTLAVHAAGSLNVGSLSSLSAGFRGSAVMTSNQPVVATLVQIPPGTHASKTRPLAPGAYPGTAVVLIASALKNTFATNSVIAVQNTDTVTNDFTIEFYKPGSTAPFYTDNTTGLDIPPGAAQYYDLGQIAGLGTSFNGSAVVSAYQSVGGDPGSAVATVMELSTAVGGKAAAAFEGAAVGGTTVFMPSAMCNFSTALNNSNFAIQNTNTFETATVTTLFSGSGVQSTVQIGPLGKASVNACNVGNAPGYLGAATITSNLPVIAIGKISGGGLSTAFMGIIEGTDTIALPYVRWASNANYDNGSRQRAFITIQNVGASTVTNNITIKYYNAAGTLVSTHTITADLAPGAKTTSNPNHQNPSDTTYEFGYAGTIGGSALVESAGASLAVVVRTSSKISGSSELAGEDYNGIPVTSNSTPYLAFIVK